MWFLPLPRALSLEWTKEGEREWIPAPVGGHLREWNFRSNPIIGISEVGCGCSGTKYRDGDCFASWLSLFCTKNTSPGYFYWNTVLKSYKLQVPGPMFS